MCAEYTLDWLQSKVFLLTFNTDKKLAKSEVQKLKQDTNMVITPGYKNVLSWQRKQHMGEQLLMLKGRVFQTVRATTTKLRKLK